MEKTVTTDDEAALRIAPDTATFAECLIDSAQVAEAGGRTVDAMQFKEAARRLLAERGRAEPQEGMVIVPKKLFKEIICSIPSRRELGSLYQRLNALILEFPACKGKNCGRTDGTHSEECYAEHEATVNPDGKYDAAPATSQDALDAKRYRWLRDENKRIDYTSDWKAKDPRGRLLEAITSDVPECFKITLLFHHVPKGGEPIWKEGGHIDWAANMDAAIDAAMRKEGE
jgi:hypothetical protein